MDGRDELPPNVTTRQDGFDQLEAPATAAVDAVSRCRLPSFWKTQPDLWFIQVEGVFRAHRITSDVTKYGLILAELDQDTVREIADVLRTPPTGSRYDALKAAILSRLTDSPDRQLQTLLTGLELGEQRPSQLLRRMRSLARSRVPDDVLRVKWLDMLPPPTRRILRVLKAASLDELAESADELVDQGSAVNAVAPPPSALRERSSSPRAPSMLAEEMAGIRLVLTQLLAIAQETRHAGRSRSRVRSSSRSRAPSAERSGRASPAPHEVCWYHREFGAIADRCRPPCNFPRSSTAPEN